tara:strand:+ start:641 stop:832 length:192 start_codon:yes stop_codon:yes gene_type:complete
MVVVEREGEKWGKKSVFIFVTPNSRDKEDSSKKEDRERGQKARRKRPCAWWQHMRKRIVIVMR